METKIANNTPRSPTPRKSIPRQRRLPQKKLTRTTGAGSSIDLLASNKDYERLASGEGNDTHSRGNYENVHQGAHSNRDTVAVRCRGGVSGGGVSGGGVSGGADVAGRTAVAKSRAFRVKRASAVQDAGDRVNQSGCQPETVPRDPGVMDRNANGDAVRVDGSGRNSASSVNGRSSVNRRPGSGVSTVAGRASVNNTPRANGRPGSAGVIGNVRVISDRVCGGGGDGAGGRRGKTEKTTEKSSATRTSAAQKSARQVSATSRESTPLPLRDPTEPRRDLECKNDDAYLTVEKIKKKYPVIDLMKMYEIEFISNKIERIQNIDCFKQLRILNLSCNCITDIATISNNKMLNEIILYDNRIEDIDSLNRLPDLVNVQLQHNRIKSIGKAFNNLRKLKAIRLDHNLLSTIGIRDFAHCSNLQTLDLSNNGIDNISAVNSCTNLVELSVRNNRLSKVDDISRLQKLQDLDLSGNSIKNTSILKNLNSLVYLNISENNITSLRSIGPLVHLTSLNCSANHLKYLDNIDDCCPLVENLDLSQNLIEDQRQLFNLMSLGELYELCINDNPIAGKDGNTSLATAGEMQTLYADLKTTLTTLEYLDTVKILSKHKSTKNVKTPVAMRPSTAGFSISTRQVENQIINMKNEMIDFEKAYKFRFESMKKSLASLSKDESETQTPRNNNVRSRLSDAMQFAKTN